MTGIDKFRRATKLFGWCREDWVQRYSTEELLKIAEAHFEHVAKEWDIYPDQWEEAQVQALLAHGTIPRFDLNIDDELEALY